MNLIFPGKSGTLVPGAWKLPGLHGGCVAAAHPWCSSVSAGCGSDSRPNLSKHLHWMDASTHLSALLEQASSFHLGENLGTGCSLQRDRWTMPALALSTQSSPPEPPSQACAP